MAKKTKYKLDKVKVETEETKLQKEVDKYALAIESFFVEVVKLSNCEEFLTVGEIPDIPEFKGTYDPLPKSPKKYVCETIYADSHPWSNKTSALICWIGQIMYNIFKKGIIGSKNKFKFAWRVRPEAKIIIDFETMKKGYSVYSRSLFWSKNA